MNRTGTEQKRDNRSDNALTPSQKISNESRTKAGGQAGYAPDCKACAYAPKINTLAENHCQDISETKWERDNEAKRAYATVAS